MRKRLIVVVACLAVVVLYGVPKGSASGAKGVAQRYSQAWLAVNHTKYDTPITAQYEAQIGYGKGNAGSALPLAPRTNVRMSSAAFAGNQNEFQIDINPLNHLCAVGASNDGRTSGTGYYRTCDGGRTWTSGDMPGIGASCCDPGVVYSDDGTVYFANLDTSPAVVHVTKSVDDGLTWTKMTDVPSDDRDNITIDNGTTSPHHGRLYITYSDFSVNQIQLKYSDNGGVSWSGPFVVSHTSSSGGAYPQSSQPRVANDGTVYVGFQYYRNGLYATAQDMIAKSTDGGVTFQPAVIISAGPHLQGGLDLGDARGYYATNSSCSTFRHRSFPIIGIDPTNSNNVYATWAGGDLEIPYTCGSLSGWHSDILFSRSTDGGATWGAPLKVNDDPAGKDQYYPWMDVAPDGVIWIGWHDRRDDPNNFKHVYYVDLSKNGGLSFGTDRRMGTFQSQPDTFIGDYAGLAAENDVVRPMWWDSRNSANGDPYTALMKGI